MRLRQSLQIFLILIEAGMLAFISENPWAPIFLGILSLAGFHPIFPLPFSKNLSTQFFLLGGLGLSIHWALFPPQFISFSRPEYYRTGFLISEAVLMLQLMAVFMLCPRYWKQVIPYGGILVYMFAGIRILAAHDHRSQIYGLGAFLFALFLGFYAIQSTERSKSKPVRGRAMVISALLILIGFLTFGLGQFLPSLEGKVTQLAVGILSPLRTGAVGGWGESSHLRSIQIQKDESDHKVILRVFSEEAPGYIRGLVYDRYRDGRWITPSGLAEIRSSSDTELDSLRLSETGYLYLTGSIRDPNDIEAITVWQDKDLGPRLFRTMGTVAFLVDAPMIYEDDLGNLKIENDGSPGTYETYRNSLRFDPPTSIDLTRFLELESEIEESVEGFSQTIFEGSTELEDQLICLRRYFATHHAYNLDIDVDSGEDPVIYFLNNQESAHCEYFASAAVLLLRAKGIAARYVTGFLSFSKNSMGGYWISTNDDAHAWVEVYHPGKGWVTFDPTPPSGVPIPSEFGWLASMKELIGFRINEAVSALIGTIKSMISAGMVAIQSIGPRQVAVFAATLALVVLVRGWWKYPSRVRKKKDHEGKALSPENRDLQDLLETMDRIVADLGFHRAPVETLSSFATRLEAQCQRPLIASSLVEWYRYFVEVRYGEANRLEAIENLKTSMGSICASFTRSPR